MGQIVVKLPLVGSNFANPTATVGPAATNGVALTAMRSDAAPAINLTANYPWTGNHTFTPAAGDTTIAAGALVLNQDNQQLQIGAGQDLRVYHDGTDTFLQNDTGNLWLWTNQAAGAGSIRMRRNGGSPFISGYDNAGTTRNGFLQFQDVGSGATTTLRNETANGILALITSAGGSARITVGANESGRFDDSAVAGDTRFLLWDVTAGALVRVTRGAADSGGAGFRVLRVPN